MSGDSRLKNLLLALMTITGNRSNRKTCYLHATVEGLLREGVIGDPRFLPVHLMLGNSDDSHVHRYYAEPDRYRVCAMPSEDFSGLERRMDKQPDLGELRGLRFLALNCWRSLMAIAEYPDSDAVLVLQDDTKFSSGFSDRLDRTLADITSAHGDNYVLNLCAYYSAAPIGAFHAGKLWCVFDEYKKAGALSGDTAVLYPRRVALLFAEYLRKNAVLEWGGATDALLGKFCDEFGIPLLASAPSLIQHVGLSSSWHTAGSCCCNNFVCSFPDGKAILGDAKFVRQRVPTQMRSGQSYWVLVEMLNSGKERWLGPSQYQLADTGCSHWGIQRINVPVGETPIGASAVFAFKVTAPVTTGSYKFQWRMFENGNAILNVGYLGEPSPAVDVVVSA